MLTSTYLQFSDYIKAGGRLREFNFLRKKISDAIAFDVDVADERGNRYMFVMQENDGTWRIKNGRVPEWVPQAESSLHAVIMEHQQAAYSH
jgi:hypothetical protein